MLKSIWRLKNCVRRITRSYCLSVCRHRRIGIINVMRRCSNTQMKKGIAYLDLNEKVEELGLNWTEDTQDKGDHLNV